MIVILPLAVLLAGAATAYLGAGRLRVLGTAAMLLATAWSLSFITPWRPAAGWVVGPLLATLVVLRPAARDRLTFEQITRRVTTLAAAALVAVFAATKFPIGENPTLLSAVAWLLTAVGAAWMISPIDERERVQASILMIAGGSALLMMALPVGLVTAAACGAMALLAPVVFRWRPPDRGAQALSYLLLLTAAAVIGAALLTGPLPRPALLDLTLALDGPGLGAAALLLVAGAFLPARGRSWVTVPGLLAVLAVSPSLRWAALAALVATSFLEAGREERFAWLALLLLASSTLFAVLVAQPWSPRAQIAGLAAALVLAALSAGAFRPLNLAFFAFVLVILQNTNSASASLVTRFQWVAAAGAALLVVRALLQRKSDGAQGALEAAMIFGLLLLAVAAHDTPALGALAAVLLLVDLIVRRNITFQPLGHASPRTQALLLGLARSGWPPTVRFAGVTLAVVAALQTSLAAGLLAALLLLGLKLAPLLEPDRASGRGHPQWVNVYLSPALSLACGLAPALVLRILRV